MLLHPGSAIFKEKVIGVRPRAARTLLITTETLGALKPQEGTSSHELKDTLAYVVEELRRGNPFKYLQI